MMLARNFKSAEQLRISGKLHAALITLLGMMERGEVVHIKIKKAKMFAMDWPDELTIPVLFNMSRWISSSDDGCGTVMCIGGACETIMDAVINDQEKNVCEPLFFPPPIGIDLRTITVPQAAQAIRNFLDNGNPRWQEICQ